MASTRPSHRISRRVAPPCAPPCRRVLVVVDKPDTLLLIKMALRARGYRVGLAADGDMALQQLNTTSWDAVVLDLTMPVPDGWAVLAATQLLSTPPDVLVLSNQKGLERAMALGAASWISKPFTIDDLVSTLVGLPAMAHDELPTARASPLPRRVGSFDAARLLAATP